MCVTVWVLRYKNKKNGDRGTIVFTATLMIQIERKDTYVFVMSIYVLKGSSENGQMRVCLTGQIGGIFCIPLLCQREKELSAVRNGASSYIFKKRLGL